MERYTIPTAAREDVMKTISRLRKKAMAYGKTLACEEGPVYVKKRSVFTAEYDPLTGGMVQRRTGDEMVEVFDMTIESDVIVKEGYKVAARIEHLDGGNVINMFEDEEIPDGWRHLSPHCDHCNGNHGQKITFIVRADDGGTKQVGRTCLKDYCGIDPQQVGIMNQLRDLFLNEYDVGVCDFESHNYGDSKAFDVQKALAFAIKVRAAQGYRRSDDYGSNREKICELMTDRKEPTEEEMAKAKVLMDSIMQIPSGESANAMLDNVKSLISNAYCKASHFGYIAFAPVAYDRYVEHKERERVREEAKAKERNSEWLGEVGKRITVEVASCTLLTSLENDYGYTYLYKICTTNGDVLIWYASRLFSSEGKAIKATIKGHTERDGVRQTVVARCAAIKEP